MISLNQEFLQAQIQIEQIFHNMNYNRKKNSGSPMPETPSSPSVVYSSHVKPIVLNVSKKILNRESIFRQPSQPPTDELKKSSKMSDEQVINSQIYFRMQERLAELEKAMQEEANEHEQNMKIMDKLIQIGKEKVHHIKYDVWELRNELLELEELLEEEIQENQQLEREWQEEDQQEQNQYGQDSQQEQQEENESSSAGESQEEQQELMSKISCSIKNLMPDEDKENLMVCHNSEPVVKTCS